MVRQPPETALNELRQLLKLTQSMELVWDQDPALRQSFVLRFKQRADALDLQHWHDPQVFGILQNIKKSSERIHSTLEHAKVAPILYAVKRAEILLEESGVSDLVTVRIGDGKTAGNSEKNSDPALKATAVAKGDFCGTKLVLLDNLRSAYNVGSILRTAECCGFQVVTSGYTPTPDHPKVKKSSRGMELKAWAGHVEDGLSFLQSKRRQGSTVVSMETAASGDHSQIQIVQSLSEIKFQGQIILILGNEKFGLSGQYFETSDYILSLPMMGAKNSFNVSVAFGIAAHSLVADK